MSENLVKRVYTFAKVAKLIVYFVVYQFVFSVIGQYVSYLCYEWFVEPVAYKSFLLRSTPQISSYFIAGTAAGVFLSSLVMIIHLLLFKYVRIKRDFFHEVKRKVLYLSIAFVFCMMVVFNILAMWLGLENDMQAELDLMLDNGVGLLSMAVLAPVIEELLFRGAIQGALMRFFKNPWWGIIIASLAFGAVHMNPVQVFYGSFLGLAFGWVYYRTGSLLPAILGHVLNNTVAVISALVYGSFSEPEVAGSAGGSVGALLFCSMVAALLVYAINRIQPAVPKPWHEVGEVI